jgi:hypothetical protein
MMDTVIMTFIYVEKLRMDNEEGSTNAAASAGAAASASAAASAGAA